MNQLIEKAKEYKKPTKRKYTEDELELALVWAKGEISTKGVAKALGAKYPNNVYCFLAVALREIIFNKLK